MLLAALFSFTNISCASEKPENETGTAAEEKSPWDQISEKELRERIKRVLEISPDAADFIPELKITTDKDGNVTEIKYNISGVFTSIETLDKKTLIKMYNRINIERTRIQTERIQRQLEAVRASQNVQRPPKVYTPPAVPRPHRPPPQPPKVPPAPPTPRHR